MRLPRRARRVAGARVSVFLLALALAVPALGAPPDPDLAAVVEARLDGFDPGTAQVTFTLTGRTPARVCSVVVRTTYWWPDGYEETVTTLAPAPRPDRCLEPGESLRATARPPAGDAAALAALSPAADLRSVRSVEVIAVVDGWGRGFGDPVALRRIRRASAPRVAGPTPAGPATGAPGSGLAVPPERCPPPVRSFSPSAALSRCSVAVPCCWPCPRSASPGFSDSR